MGVKFTSGVVIFRQWNEHDGLHEVSQTFNTLEEMVTLCTRDNKNYMVERVVIDSEDDSGDSRTLTLVFQSSTLPDHTGE
jgi:hypothetical protein